MITESWLRIPYAVSVMAEASLSLRMISHLHRMSQIRLFSLKDGRFAEVVENGREEEIGQIYKKLYHGEERQMFRMFWYEIKMDFLRSIRYRFGMISDLLVYFALFTVFMVTDSGNSYAQTYHYGNYKELVLLGYVAWIYAISAISNVAGSLQSELTHGTLYKKVSSKYPLQYLFGGLYVSSVLLETITIVIVVIISKFVWGIEFFFSSGVFWCRFY